VFFVVDHGREVAAVVDDQLELLAVGKDQRLLDAPVVILVGLALPGVNRHAGGRDGRRRVVLRGKLVATAPSYQGAKLGERLDQNGRLDRHVQAARHMGAGQRFRPAVLLPQCHQARHFVLGQVDFLATPFGQRKISNLVR